MAKETILIADNNPEYLATTAEKLEREGYKTIRATNPEQAKQILETVPVDLAILDLRLTDDTDNNDISGLSIAKEVSRGVPKIILTGYPNIETAREALALDMQGVPRAVDLVPKVEGYGGLSRAVRRGLALSGHFRQAINAVSSQLEQDHRDARQQAKVNYLASLAVSLVGMMIIFAGTILVLSDMIPLGVATGLVGIIVEASSYLFFGRVDASNRRIDDRYHSELFQLRQFDILMSACSELPADQQCRCQEMVIRRTITQWLTTQNPKYTGHDQTVPIGPQ